MATASLDRKARQFNQPGRTEYRLKMTARILIAAALLALATACSSPTTETATPRPTDTPSPTYTPEPLLPPGNINSLPTPVPLPPLGPSSALPTPTISPDIFQGVGDKEWFFGATALELGRANQAFDEGRYQDALEAYLEAQRLHGEPSIIIQGLIGSSYRALGQPETAIQHFTNALELKDDPINRINRARSYMKTGHCPPAINDAKAALTMEPEAGEGIHSDAEANDILTSYYAEQGEYLLALQHAEVTLEIAEENRYAETELEYVSRVRDSLQAVVDGRTWPEDLILGPAATVFYAGTAFLEEGQYEEAIANFNAAQENPAQPPEQYKPCSATPTAPWDTTKPP